MSEAVVVVVGAGPVGVCVANELYNRGIACVVIDERAIGDADACRIPGLITRWNAKGAEPPLRKRGWKLHNRMAKQLRGKDSYDMQRAEAVYLKTRSNLEFGLAALGPRAAEALTPDWIDGSAAVEKGFVVGSTVKVASIDPAKFCISLMGSSQSANFIQSEIKTINVSENGERVTSLELNGHPEPIAVSSLVLAMDAFDAQMYSWFPTLPQFKAVQYHALQCTSNDNVAPHIVFVDHTTGGGDQISPELLTLPNNQVLACAPTDNPTDYEPLRRVVAELSTVLSDAPMKEISGFHTLETRDGRPVVGQVPQFENVLISAGHGSWVTLEAPAAAGALADLITLGQSKIDVSALQPGRFANE